MALDVFNQQVEPFEKRCAEVEQYLAALNEKERGNGDYHSTE
jgi:phosphopantetheine adenylyltransferase